MKETNNQNTDSEMPFCLLWDLERKEYARVESPWSDQDLKSVARFEVRARFKTEQELVDALEKAKNDLITQNEKRIGVIGVGGGGSVFLGTIMNPTIPTSVVIDDSRTTGTEISDESTSSQFFPRTINIDHDYNPIGNKMKKGSNFTPKKKKRKK